MKMMRKITNGLLVVILGLMTGCASTTVSGIWRDPAYTGGPMTSMMVIAIAEKPLTRKMFEDEFVRELKARGINAVNSYNEFPNLEDLKRDDVRAKVQSSGLAGVLVTRLVDVKKETVNVTQQPNQTFGGYYNYAYAAPLVSTSYSYSYDYMIVNIETNVFDLKTARSVWTAMTSTEDPVKLDASIKEFSKVIIDRMASAGIIK